MRLKDRSSLYWLEEITVMGCCCKRCDYKWMPVHKESKPPICPRCRSPWWYIKNKFRKCSQLGRHRAEDSAYVSANLATLTKKEAVK